MKNILNILKNQKYIFTKLKYLTYYKTLVINENWILLEYNMVEGWKYFYILYELIKINIKILKYFNC